MINNSCQFYKFTENRIHNKDFPPKFTNVLEQLHFRIAFNFFTAVFTRILCMFQNVKSGV